MNLIANCCAGGEFYIRVLKDKFTNPFIWSSIAPNDMINLILSYDDLNFENIELVKDTKTLERFSILIDGKIRVHFPHHRFKADCKKPLTIKPNVFYNKIWELLEENWNTRVKRMKELPVFLILTHRLHDEYTYSNCSDSDIEKILNLDTKFKIIIMSPLALKSTKKNILCIRCNTVDHVKCVTDYKDKILGFINESTL